MTARKDATNVLVVPVTQEPTVKRVRILTLMPIFFRGISSPSAHQRILTLKMCGYRLVGSEH